MEDTHTLVAAYVLDAVDDLERVAVDRHLRACETCRAEVDELREASARLAATAWSVPPPRLRDSVLASIATTRQVAGVSPAAPSATVAPRRSRLRSVSAAAVVVVAVGGAAGGAWVVQNQRVRDERANVEAARADESLTRAVLAAPDLITREAALTGGGRVSVASSKLNGAGVVMLTADAAPPRGKIYQIWTIQGRDATPVGSMVPGQSTNVQLVKGLPAANAVGVTVESGPGATVPAQPLVGSVPLT